MPPAPRLALSPRATGSGKNFTIVFSIIAFLVIMGCIAWGYILPKWKKKHPGRPSATRHNGLAPPKNNGTEFVSSQRFPSHPAILRGFKKQLSRELRHYDPHTETPFPTSPPIGDTISLPSVKLRSSTSSPPRNLYSGHGYCNPEKGLTTRSTETLRYPVPKTPGTLSEFAADRTNVQEFGDARDFILAVPEPLALKPRIAGRPPPLTKQLEKFPTPGSTNSDKLAHPNKLFAELQEVDEEHGRSGTRTKYPISDTDEDSDESPPDSSIFGPHRYGDSRGKLKFVKEKSVKSAQADIRSTTTAGSSILTRKKKFRNPFMDPPDQTSNDLARSGTITRPKTPVAEIRSIYDRGVPEFKMSLSNHPSMTKHLTPSTEPLTESVFAESGAHQSSSPPSSMQIPVEKLPLLPTPLRPRRAYMRAVADTPTPTPSSAALPESPDKLAPLHKSLRSKRQQRSSIGFYHARSSRGETAGARSRDTVSGQDSQQVKLRPANLSLTRSFRVQSPYKRNRGHYVSSASSLLAPLMSKKVARHSGQASSIYSRDTKGMSIIRSPLTPKFPEEAVIREPAAPEHLDLKRANSFDMIRSKIDEWDLHTGDLNLSNSPAIASALKRTLSDQGPRSPAQFVNKSNFQIPPLDFSHPRDVPHPTGLGVSIPTICIGRTSDDIFRDDAGKRHSDGQLAKKSIHMDRSGSSSNLSSLLGRTAPGGAEWI